MISPQTKRYGLLTLDVGLTTTLGSRVRLVLFRPSYHLSESRIFVMQLT